MSAPWSARGLAVLDSTGNRIGRAELGFGLTTPAEAEANAALMAQAPALVAQLASEQALSEKTIAACEDSLFQHREELARCGPLSFNAYNESEQLRALWATAEAYIAALEARSSKLVEKKDDTIASLCVVVRGFRDALTRIVAAKYPSKEMAQDALMKFGMTDDADANKAMLP